MYDILVYMHCVVTRLRVTAVFFFLMIRRPPRSTLDRSSAASDVYKRQPTEIAWYDTYPSNNSESYNGCWGVYMFPSGKIVAVSYTHLRAHETVLDIVCRLLLEKKTRPILEATFVSIDVSFTSYTTTDRPTLRLESIV